MSKKLKLSDDALNQMNDDIPNDFRVVRADMPAKRGRNTVSNQKYSIVTFLPLILWQQFKFFFNLYFLLVALSQLVPALRIGYLFTYFTPLAFVLSVTIVKEAYDDYVRYLRDCDANRQACLVMQADGAELQMASSQLKVGDIIKVNKDERVPADLIVFQTVDGRECFIRTDQMDGETDQKMRVALQLTRDSTECVELHIEQPHKDIYAFTGTAARGEHKEPVSLENVVWANCVVASKGVIGMVVYTGRELRAVMNTSQPESKVGLLDLEINRLSKILCAVLLAISFALVAMSGFRGKWYIVLMRFLIIFSSIIPISLRVNLELAKTWYAQAMQRDVKIPGMVVRSSTIPEELGRVSHLLTDKTGTLTCNEMEMRRVHLGTMAFDADDAELGGMVERVLSADLNGKGKQTMRRGDIDRRLVDMVIAMALCHNVTPVIEDGDVSYEASSPDEVAIIKWTQLVGLKLVFRDQRLIRLEQANGSQMEFEVLNIFPFTSESKRMGIVVRNCQTEQVTVYIKGADVVLAKLCKQTDWLDEESDNMAREGLRTLVFGKRELSAEQYSQFSKEYDEAKVSLTDRSERISTVMQTIEHSLNLLGLSGVDDKLQEDVKQTLESLRNAGVRIWMLTGDKVETATNIAISSKLVARSQSIYSITQLDSHERAADELQRLDVQVDCALIIDGHSLQFYLDNMAQDFVQSSAPLSAVICCRCSPTQKQAVTTLIKNSTTKRVCAIGDGGNDVSMIQAAHVGVGIVGKEGQQASLAADFSITQFSHLARLLLWHGRNSYRRSAKLSQFIIHRGLIIAIIQAVFSSIFYFAPIPLYQNIILVGYSTLYTMAPVFSLVLDTDVNEHNAILYPELYKQLTKGRALSLKTFFSWLLISIYQACSIMILAIVLFEDDFLHVVSISFTALIFNELLMVALEINTWHRWMVVAEIVTLGIYIASMFLLPTEFDMSFILTSGFVWRTAVITSVSCVPLYIVRLVKITWAPPTYQKLDS